MGELQKILDEKVLNAPILLFEELLAKKFSEAGITNAKKAARHFIEHIRSDNPEPFQWEDPTHGDADIALEISSEEMDEIEQRVKRYQKNLPGLVEGLSIEIADTLLRSMRAKWKEEQRLQFSENKQFRKRLEGRWGKPLSLMRMMLTIAREFNGNAFHGLPRSKKRVHMRNVLQRLHVRACQVMGEIITLLENGFADGAMARWRTLHEIGVVGTFIHEAGEDTAERYAAHQAVEAKQGLEEYHRCYEDLGYRPMPKSSCDRIIRKFDAAVTKYGPEFGRPYGWAAAKLGIKKVTFGDLEAAIGRTEMRSYYKLASYNVHAGPHGAFYRLGLIDNTSGLLGGASNAGLMEPGQNAAHTLMQISALLLSERRDFDQLVAMKIMMRVRDEIPKEFAKADRKLRRDDAKVRTDKVEVGTPA